MTPPDQVDASPTSEALAKLRHRLRTPLQMLVGYCTALAEDVAGSDDASRGAAEEALYAVRDALSLIDAVLPLSRNTVPPEEVAQLYESLHRPQQQLARALMVLIAPDHTLPNHSFGQRVPATTDTPAEAIERGARRAASALPAARPSGDAGLGPAADVRDLPAARILLADDQQEMRLALQRVLEREGYIAECAENGRAALDMAARQPYDLILLDITMPEMDGFEALERLKDAAETRDIPVLMISAVDDLQSVARCIEHGAEDHLSKPFQPVLLRARVRSCLEKKRLRDLEKEYLQRVNQVIDAASAVESGTYRTGGLAQVAARADELGRLARVFNKMAAQVKTREEHLAKQVRDLKSEIEKASPEAKEVRRSSMSMPVLPELLSGQLFAERYEVLEKVGSGGMGTVYKAHDRELDDDVAIKTLRSELLEGSATLVERFKSEIRLARRISHHNVVRTHDFGEWDGTYYLTMEYVEGITVRELIDTRGQVGVSSTIAIGAQLAQSLDVAHREGVIHRDVKPANLLLDEAGVLKVMDFGVACLADRRESLTRPGAIVGTPTYMAPEQLLGGNVDVRSDLYSVGVVLYECLTGKPPFDADDSTPLIVRLIEEELPSPSALAPDVPPAFAALVVRLLALRPDDRLASARELAEQLAQLA